MVVAAKAELEN